jgi:hypothetical protein
MDSWAALNGGFVLKSHPFLLLLLLLSSVGFREHEQEQYKEQEMARASGIDRMGGGCEKMPR